MNLDKSRIRFMSKAISVASQFGGAIDRDEAANFFDTIYSEWTASNLSLEKTEAWLKDRLSNAFQSIGHPPVWIEDLSSWPYLDGKPMVFLCQCTMRSNELTDRELSPGETVYLFGGRKIAGDKIWMEYKVVSQYQKEF